jgi:hypothetical protein
MKRSSVRAVTSSAVLFSWRRVHVLLAVALAALLLASPSIIRVHAAAGDLDPSFGFGGRVTTDFFSSVDTARAVALQIDGKIVAVGHTTTFNRPFDDFAVARYNRTAVLTQPLA